jgi:hypothetical protein
MPNENNDLPDLDEVLRVLWAQAQNGSVTVPTNLFSQG